ncbi:MAG: APC family permease [Candidatus Dormibacteraceae bacterium]
MSFTQLLFMSLTSIIGSGWLLASVHAATDVGPAAILSWLIGAGFIMLIALGWSEIGSMIPRSGAIVRIPAITHGSLTGWLVGWAYWFPITPAAETIAVLTYLSGKFPNVGWTYVSQGQTLLTWPTGIVTGIGFMIFFFILNYFGIRFLAEWNRWFTWWKIIIPILTFIGLFFMFKGSNFSVGGGFAPHGTATIFESLSTSGIIFAYLGFRQSIEYAGEARNPQRDVPLATIGAVLICMAIYTLLQVGFIGAIDWHVAGIHVGDWAALDTSKWGDAPLYSALASSNIAAWAAFSVVLLIDAAVSPTATSWVSMGTATRTFYALSINRNFPEFFQTMSRWGIPWISLLGSFIIGILFLAPLPSWTILISFISGVTVITYMMGGVGLISLRKYAPMLYRPFKLPFAWIIAPLGFLAASMLMYWAAFSTLVNVFAAIFIGFPIYGAYFSWKMRYVHWIAGVVISAIFLGTFLWVNHMGGWVLSLTAVSATPGPLPGSWSWPAYDIAFSADVIFFLAALYVFSTAEGRLHIRHALWLVFVMLASFPLAYWGSVGPLAKPAVVFPWDVLIMVGIGIVGYIWGCYSGFLTEELRDILHTAGLEPGTGRLPILPWPGGGTGAPPVAPEPEEVH